MTESQYFLQIDRQSISLHCTDYNLATMKHLQKDQQLQHLKKKLALFFTKRRGMNKTVLKFVLYYGFTFTVL